MAATIIQIFDTGDFHQQIARAIQILKDGGVVVLPTETVYGAAGLLTRAQERLAAIRGNSETRPLTIHLASRDQASRYLGEVGELGRRMMKKLWPGPVGLSFAVPEPRRKQVAAELGIDERDLYQDGRITLRCPDHPVAQEIIAAVPGPIVATVAGNSDPRAIADALDGKVDLVIDAGPLKYNKPSTLVHVNDASYEIVRTGVYDERIIERLLKTTILFVCSGNTCRSPMAESLARKIIANKLSVAPSELESKGINVVSAGSFAMPGARATPQAVDAVKELGVDLSRHRSRPLSVELIHQADAIFTMGRSHLQAVTALVPSASEKTSTLNPDGEIEDPIGGDLQLYRNLAKKLEPLIEKRLKDASLM